MLLKAQHLNQEEYGLVIKVIGIDDGLRVDFPNGNSYPWTKYYRPIDEVTAREQNEELYALKRILEPFRKHGKKEFGKHFEFIENRMVKGSPLREKMLQYLVERKILRKNIADRLYYMDDAILKSEGINWGDLKSFTESNGIVNFLTKFNLWNK